MTSWCHLDFSSAFAVFPNTHILYKLTAYDLYHSYLGWLCCYITSGYVLSESTVYVGHPLKHFLVLPKDLSLGSPNLFITVLCNSIKHSLFFVCWHYQNCSFHKLCTWQYTWTVSHSFCLCLVCCWLYETECWRKSAVQCWQILTNKERKNCDPMKAWMYKGCKMVPPESQSMQL